MAIFIRHFVDHMVKKWAGALSVLTFEFGEGVKEPLLRLYPLLETCGSPFDFYASRMAYVRSRIFHYRRRGGRIQLGCFVQLRQKRHTPKDSRKSLLSFSRRHLFSLFARIFKSRPVGFKPWNSMSGDVVSNWWVLPGKIGWSSLIESKIAFSPDAFREIRNGKLMLNISRVSPIHVLIRDAAIIPPNRQLWRICLTFCHFCHYGEIVDTFRLRGLIPGPSGRPLLRIDKSSLYFQKTKTMGMGRSPPSDSNGRPIQKYRIKPTDSLLNNSHPLRTRSFLENE